MDTFLIVIKQLSFWEISSLL